MPSAGRWLSVSVYQAVPTVIVSELCRWKGFKLVLVLAKPLLYNFIFFVSNTVFYFATIFYYNAKAIELHEDSSLSFIAQRTMANRMVR